MLVDAVAICGGPRRELPGPVRGSVILSLCLSVILAGLPGIARAADWPTTVEGIAQYRGSDRQQMLEAGAKKERALVYYTHNSNKVARDAVIDAFRKRYPFIDVSNYSASQGAVEERVRQEDKVGRNVVDLLESGGVYIAEMRKERMTLPYYSPSVANLSPRAYLSAGDGKVYFATGVVSVGSIAYNTSLVPANLAPKSWDDLLNPAFREKIAVTGQSPLPQEWLAAAIKAKGADWVLKLKDQKIKRLNVSGAGIAQAVASGQYPIGLAVYNTGFQVAKAEGNPIEWVALEPLQVVTQSLHLSAKAPHPHAAMLWVDWMLSDEGQAAYAKFGFITTGAKSESVINKMSTFDRMSEPNYIEDYKKWDALVTEIIGN